MKIRMCRAWLSLRPLLAEFCPTARDASGPEGDSGSEYRNAIIDSSQGGSCPEPSQFLAIVCLLKLAGFCGFFHLPTHRS